MPKYSSQAPIEFSGYTLQHDELIEWRDDEASQHAVTINREWRGLPDITFLFGMQSEAHALFMALCQAENIAVDGEELPLSNEIVAAWQELQSTPSYIETQAALFAREG